jgi:hypothetical protein
MDNFAEKHSINLQESLERIKSTKVGFFEAELPELSYAGGNRVKFGTDTYELSPQPWQALCKYLEIPEHLLPRLSSVAWSGCALTLPMVMTKTSNLKGSSLSQRTKPMTLS